MTNTEVNLQIPVDFRPFCPFNGVNMQKRRSEEQMKRPMLILLVVLLAGAAVCGWLQQGDLFTNMPAVATGAVQPTEELPEPTPPVTVTPTDIIEAVG